VSKQGFFKAKNHQLLGVLKLFGKMETPGTLRFKIKIYFWNVETPDISKFKTI
jgi:hypothetical protein